MGTSKDDLRGWFDRGVEDGALFMEVQLAEFRAFHMPARSQDG